MDKYHFGSRRRPEKRVPQRHHGDASFQSLSAEGRPFQGIAARTFLSETLNEICSSLDRGIGNVVSLIFPWHDDATDLDAIAANATRFGLHVFYSAGVFAGNGELLGSLEIYSCVPRDLLPGESQVIERAKRVAAIAIKVYDDTNEGSTRRDAGHQLARGRLLEWPVSIN